MNNKLKMLSSNNRHSNTINNKQRSNCNSYSSIHSTITRP